MPNNKAIGYARVSTLEQSRQGISLDAQVARIEAYCQMAGLELVGVIREEGVSAGIHLSQRPQGRRLLSMIEADEINNFVALKLDRVYRSAIDALTQTEKFANKCVAVHFIDLNVDTSTAMGKMMLAMMASFAELEKNMTAERTKAALAHKKQNLKAYTMTPFGYDRVGDDLIENIGEQSAIQLMKDWRESGVSYREICMRLQDQGIKTKLGKDKWYPTTIKYILENDLYKEGAV